MNLKIVIKNKSKSGRGVFAASNIRKGEIIEVSPVIVIPNNERKILDKSFLFNYYFHWGKKNQPAIALGYGSLYNHSYSPNAEYDQYPKQKVIKFRALRNIKKGEEITTNYNGDPDSKDKLWFKAN